MLSSLFRRLHPTNMYSWHISGDGAHLFAYLKVFPDISLGNYISQHFASFSLLSSLHFNSQSNKLSNFKQLWFFMILQVYVIPLDFQAIRCSQEGTSFVIRLAKRMHHLAAFSDYSSLWCVVFCLPLHFHCPSLLCSCNIFKASLNSVSSSYLSFNTILASHHWKKLRYLRFMCSFLYLLIFTIPCTLASDRYGFNDGDFQLITVIATRDIFWLLLFFCLHLLLSWFLLATGCILCPFKMTSSSTGRFSLRPTGRFSLRPTGRFSLRPTGHFFLRPGSNSCMIHYCAHMFIEPSVPPVFPHVQNPEYTHWTSFSLIHLLFHSGTRFTILLSLAQYFCPDW